MTDRGGFMFSVGTWNVAKRVGGRAAEQIALMRENSSFWVVTEPSVIHRDEYPSAAISSAPSAKVGWVTLLADSAQQITTIGSSVHSLAAVVEQDGVPVAILGTVLPWGGAIQQAPEFHDGEATVDEVFRRVLDEQVRRLKELAKEHTHVIWAGDFNQSLWGANYGGSTARRRMLLDALADLHMIPFNAALPHAGAGMTTIDLICGTKSLQLESARRIAVRDSLSDHSAYVVELSVIK
jgi:Endonuclease-reverse transcriptase